MNLHEAEKSFDYFAERLKVQCAQLTHAAETAAAAAASTELAERARETKDLALANLKDSLRNSLALSIVIHEALTKEADQSVRNPMQLAKVITASTRLEQAALQARALVEVTVPNVVSRNNFHLRRNFKNSASNGLAISSP